MNLPHEWMNELQGLLDRLQDGGFTETDRRRLNELLQAETEAQDFFVSYLEIGSGLAWDGRLELDGRQRMPGVSEPLFGATDDMCQAFERLSGLAGRSDRTDDPARPFPPAPQPFSGGALLWYAVTALLVLVGVVATWAWRPVGRLELAGGAPPLASVTVNGERSAATPPRGTAGAGSTSAAPDSAAVEPATASGRGAGEPSTRMDLHSRSTLPSVSRPVGKRSFPCRWPINRTLVSPLCFLSRGTSWTGNGTWKSTNRRSTASTYWRGRVKFWSEDGGLGQSILLEKVGSKPLAEVMRERVLVAMMRRTCFDRRYQAALATARNRTDPQRTARPTNRRGITFLPSVVTMATPAADLVSGKPLQGNPADKELPPLARGVRYASSATFELPDVTPGSVEVWCWYFTHNRLAGIRLNGTLLSVPKQPDGSSIGRLIEFSVNESFVRGANTLEIDVDDPRPQASAASGPPRFCLALSGFWMAPGEDLPPPKRPSGAKAAESGNSGDYAHPNRTSRGKEGIERPPTLPK